VDSVDLLIRDALVVSAEGVVPGSIAVDEGRIVAISRGGDPPPAERVIDAEGRYVIPGLVDPHSHPGASFDLTESLRSDTPGAAAGGVTTIGIMHGSARARREFLEFPEPEDMIPWSQAYPVAREIGEENSVVDFFYIPSIDNVEQAEEIPRLAEEFGLCAFKFYANLKSTQTTAVGAKWKARIAHPQPFDDSMIWYGFEQIGKIGRAGIALVHHENTEVAKVFIDRLRSQGRTDPEAWTEKSPGWIEAEHISRYSRFAREAGCRLYVLHLTSKEGLAECKRSLADGTRLVVETCPHYMLLTCRSDPGVLLKVNPPIRYEEDNEALWQGIRDGVITCIGTDNVITDLNWKTILGDTGDRATDPATDIWSTGSGFVGWDLVLPLMLSEGVHKGRVTLEKVVEVCCENTARTFGLYPRKGSIRVGADADLVILDLDRTQKMTASMQHSKSDFTLFEGWELKGWPATTILRGKVIWDDGEVTGEFGCGRAIARDKDRQFYPFTAAAAGAGV
jgi:dihydropyrimidinase/dihydroorotase